MNQVVLITPNVIGETIAKMQVAQQQVALPVAYQSDLDADYSVVQKFADYPMIWLLRSYGSVLVPLYAGADPTYLRFWLEGREHHGQSLAAYFIDASKGQVDPVSDDFCLTEINKPPRVLYGKWSPEAIQNLVDETLEAGCRMGIWGVFDTPSCPRDIGEWIAWQRYFEQHGNTVMEEFMRQAQRQLRIAIENEPF